VPIEWLADFLKLIHDTPNLDWLLLSKRLENWRERVNRVLDAKCSTIYSTSDWNNLYETRQMCRRWLGEQAVPKNVWIGTSVENQEYADKRIPELLKIPAKVRFLSCEPLLGPIDLSFIENDGYKLNCLTGEQADMGRPCESGGKIDWCIIGGESGVGARPCNVEWIRDIVKQCKAAGTQCFVKQAGSNAWLDGNRLKLKHPKGGDVSEFPKDIQLREFPCH